MVDKSSKDTIDTLLKSAKKAAKQRDFVEAESILVECLARVPGHLDALDLMGFVLFFQKKYADCESYCRRALEIEPEHVYALNGLGMALSRQGEIEAGVAAMEQAMALKPTWPEPYWDMSIILIEAGEKSRAIEVLNKGIKRIPSSKVRFESLLLRIKNEK